MSERLLLVEELLEIVSPLDDDEEEADAASSGTAKNLSRGQRLQRSESTFSDTEDDDDGFDNFDEIRELTTSDSSAAETCARLERATQNLVELELEFDEGADIPTIQVCVHSYRFSDCKQWTALIELAWCVGSERRSVSR